MFCLANTVVLFQGGKTLACKKILLWDCLCLTSLTFAKFIFYMNIRSIFYIVFYMKIVFSENHLHVYTLNVKSIGRNSAFEKEMQLIFAKYV